MICLVTKHDNGTLNLWQLVFADKTKFSQVLSIGHRSRASGHRYRVNDITCHPVLPLLLTTSHHNIIDKVKGDTVGIEKAYLYINIIVSENCSYYKRYWCLIIFI